MQRLIYADALMRDIEKYHLSDGKFQHWVEVQPTIDAIPISFIQELIGRDKQLIEEYGGKPDFEVIVDGLIERAVNYEVLIEKWREKNESDD